MERIYVPTEEAYAVVSATGRDVSESARYLTVGPRIPKDYFVTLGRGESDITVHAGSYHLALRSAGIEMCNIVTYSSILPACATEVERPSELVHGSVLETIMAVSTSDGGERATAGIVWGWLHDRQDGRRHGGLVCEYNGSLSCAEAEDQLRMSLGELYENGYEERYRIEEETLHIDSFVPTKRYGTTIVSICFLNHYVPIVES